MLNHTDAAMLFKTLSDETRLRIVDMLSCDERCACDLLEAFSITQPTLSYHMKNLTDSGLVNGRRDGAWMRYTVNMELMTQLKVFLEQISTVCEEDDHDRQNCSCSKQG